MRVKVIQTTTGIIKIIKPEPFDSLIYYAGIAGNKKAIRRLKKLNKKLLKKGGTDGFFSKI